MQIIGLILLLIAMFMMTGGAVPSVRGTIGGFAFYIAMLLAPTGIVLLILGASQPAVDVPTYVVVLAVALVSVCGGGLLFLLHRIR
jgi:hypothetical protein